MTQPHTLRVGAFTVTVLEADVPEPSVSRLATFIILVVVPVGLFDQACRIIKALDQATLSYDKVSAAVEMPTVEIASAPPEHWAARAKRYLRDRHVPETPTMQARFGREHFNSHSQGARHAYYTILDWLTDAEEQDA